MTDFSEAEINAIEHCFGRDGTKCYLCDFHRLQAWDRWIKKKDNGVKTEDVDTLKKTTERGPLHDQFANYDAALRDLEQSRIWLSNDK